MASNDSSTGNNKMNTQDAFTAEPPKITIRGALTQLRPVNQGFRRVLEVVEGLVGDDPQKVARTALIAYAAVYSLPPGEAARLIVAPDKLELAVAEADMELSNEDVAAVDAYVSGVFKRMEDAAVEVQKNEPGKS